MQIEAIETPCLDWTGDALAVGLTHADLELTGDWAALDERCDRALSEAIATGEFDAKTGNAVVLRLGRTSAVRKLIAVGLGDRDTLDLNSLRAASASSVRLAKNAKVKTLGLSLPSLETAATAQAIATALRLADHTDNRFKSEDETKGVTLEAVQILGLGEQTAALSRAEAIAAGTILARELVAAPANAVTPETLAATAQQLASDYGLQLEILEREDCEKLGMGAYLGVSQASDIPPKFIHLTYKPEGTPRRKLVIVGKGVTFDSGGLNIKGAGSGIETMKMDMGGAGATLGAARAIATLQPDVEVHFISAAAENMISGHAMHPGDILTASNGKTIEVNNTDAEGRLTLADALVFAEKLGADAIVDLATLTGACIVALGNNIGGLWSNNDHLAAEVQAAAAAAGEKFWTMPLEEAYFESLKSPIADMKNTGARAGGSITAALFLKQFVGETPWVHLDIAGPVWAEKEDGVNNAGATGFPVQTLVQWVLA
ncbi:MAG: leucyl aminopeptidase [Spirulinaceae cyanobacterium SM2_1_0]|nr:leucyl aminopeptidase [Spirulinaceae cyanobacterium SM2_1_0]